MTKHAQRFEAVAPPASETAPRRRRADVPRAETKTARPPAADKHWTAMLSRERPLLLELFAWAVCTALLLTVYAVSWRFVPL